MVDVTLFEVHLDGSSFSANAPFSGSGEQQEEREQGGGARRGVGVLVGLVFLVVLAVLLRQRLGGESEEGLA